MLKKAEKLRRYPSFVQVLSWPLAVAGFVAGLLLPISTSAFAAQLRRASTEGVASFNPQHARTPQARLLARDLFEGLVTLDADRQPVPGAAHRWHVTMTGV